MKRGIRLLAISTPRFYHGALGSQDQLPTPISSQALANSVPRSNVEIGRGIDGKGEKAEITQLMA